MTSSTPSELVWPPGGRDALIEVLVRDHGIAADCPDWRGLLHNPRLGRIALISSFGADSIALLHYVAARRPDLPVIFLDTGKSFLETLSHVDRLAAQLNLEFQKVRPDPALLAEENPDGMIWTDSPDFCCRIRKVYPMQGALAGYYSWVSGQKRFQSWTRHALPILERDRGHLKINLLVTWYHRDLSSYIEFCNLPLHPLTQEEYLSIGCAYCTRRVAPGDDPRSGRWAHLPEKTECDIHLGSDGCFRRGRA